MGPKTKSQKARGRTKTSSEERKGEKTTLTAAEENPVLDSFLSTSRRSPGKNI